jgi:hypothetical protein
MADPLILEVIDHITKDNFKAAVKSFDKYNKAYLWSNTKGSIDFKIIRGDLDRLVPYVLNFPRDKSIFGAAHSNLFKRQEASGDWDKYLLRTMIGHAYSDIGGENPLASRTKKRKLGNRNAPVMFAAPVASVAENVNNTGNINNKDYPYTGKVRFPTPPQYKEIGTLGINRRSEPTNKKPGRPTKKSKWGPGWVELPNSPDATAKVQLAPKGRNGEPLLASNDKSVVETMKSSSGEPPSSNQHSPRVIQGLGNNNNNNNNIDPRASAYSPGYVPRPYPGPLPEAVPALASSRLTPLLVGQNPANEPGIFTLSGPPLPAAPAVGPGSPGFRPGPGNTPKTVSELQNLGFRGGKKRTANRKRSTRRTAHRKRSTRRFAHRKH